MLQEKKKHLHVGIKPCQVLGAYSLKWPIQGGSARKGYHFQASGIWKGRDSLVEVCERVCKMAQKGWQMHLMAVKKSRKRSGFVIYSYFFQVRFCTTWIADRKGHYIWTLSKRFLCFTFRMWPCSRAFSRGLFWTRGAGLSSREIRTGPGLA